MSILLQYRTSELWPEAQRYRIQMICSLTMKYALTAVLLALSAAPADACKTDWLGWCRNDRILPPPAYDKPFPGLLVEDTAHDKQDMARLCAPHPKADQLLGCSSLRAFNDGSSATFTLRPS